MCKWSFLYSLPDVIPSKRLKKDTGTQENNSTFIFIADKVFGYPVAWAEFICNFNYQLPDQEWALHCVIEISRGAEGSGRENHPSQLHYGYNFVLYLSLLFCLYDQFVSSFYCYLVFSTITTAVFRSSQGKLNYLPSGVFCFVLFSLLFFFLTGRRKKRLPLLRSLGFQRACQNISEDLQRRKAVRKRPENLDMPLETGYGVPKRDLPLYDWFLARLS